MTDASEEAGANAADPQPGLSTLRSHPEEGQSHHILTVEVTVGFLAILLTLLVLGLALYHNHRAVGRLLEQMIMVDHPLSAAAYEMEINAVEAGLGVVKYVATGDPQQRERVRKDEEDFQHFKLEYDRLTETQREKELGRQIDTVHARYRRLGDALMDAHDEQAALMAQVAEAFWNMDGIIDDQIQTSLERDQANGPAKLLESGSVEADLAEVGTWLGNYLSTSKPAYRERIFDNLQDVRGHLAAFQKLALDAAERQWAVQLQLLFQQTTADISKILDLHDGLTRDEAEFILLRGQLDDLFDEGVQTLTRRNLAAIQTQARNTIQRLHSVSLILLALSVLACAVAAGLILHRSGRLHQEMKLRAVSESARAQLLEHLVSAQEEERGHLARELHDQLGHELSTLVSGLKELDRSSAAERSAASQRLQHSGSRLIEQVRTIAWELRPAALDHLGLEGALSSYVEDWMQRTGVPVDFQSELKSQRLPAPIETTLYRVAQEALTNVIIRQPRPANARPRGRLGGGR